ncbi:sulfur carrier protein ThiS, partial [Eggerthella sp.]
ADGSTLAQLLERDGFDAARVACELNGAIVPRDAYAATVLRAGDVLEVVRFVGGG